MATIVWTTVNREFTKLLEDLTAIDFGSEPMQPGFAVDDDPAGDIAPPRVRGEMAGLRLTSDQLAEWSDAAALLRQTLTEGINSRAAALRRTPDMSFVREKLAQLRTFQESARRLTNQLADVTPEVVLVELNDIGRQVCGDAWPEPPLPGEQ